MIGPMGAREPRGLDLLTTHTPPPPGVAAQTSPDKHPLSSAHDAPDPVITSTVPWTQTPPWHVSPVVQALPSSHGLLLLLWTQPEAVAQVSSVQTFPSSQFG